mmetsp:Transcript_13113/g.29087  ORF Transcript_13113/g.29087 Transcript_13113/m.29087 type:complete len:238 (+) Transcript_13113:1506-2219(+)
MPTAERQERASRTRVRTSACTSSGVVMVGVERRFLLGVSVPAPTPAPSPMSHSNWRPTTSSAPRFWPIMAGSCDSAFGPSTLLTVAQHSNVDPSSFSLSSSTAAEAGAAARPATAAAAMAAAAALLPFLPEAETSGPWAILAAAVALALAVAGSSSDCSSPPRVTSSARVSARVSAQSSRRPRNLANTSRHMRADCARALRWWKPPSSSSSSSSSASPCRSGKRFLTTPRRCMLRSR